MKKNYNLYETQVTRKLMQPNTIGCCFNFILFLFIKVLVSNDPDQMIYKTKEINKLVSVCSQIRNYYSQFVLKFTVLIS